MDQDERLRLRTGLLAIARALAPTAPITVLEQKVMQVPDHKLTEISERFSVVAQQIMVELKLGGT